VEAVIQTWSSVLSPEVSASRHTDIEPLVNLSDITEIELIISSGCAR
jgi:hypothetical protein